MVVNVGSVVGTLPEAAAGVELAAAALRALAGLKAKIDSFAAGSSLAASSSTDAGTDDDNNQVTGDGTDDGSDGVTADGIHCVDKGAVAAACKFAGTNALHAFNRMAAQLPLPQQTIAAAVNNLASDSDGWARCVLDTCEQG
uniref:Uncharacterized protein n=1 Tax=Tetradesmus obliquus TaxID=3088 RepID=A0A383VK41_TETOB